MEKTLTINKAEALSNPELIQKIVTLEKLSKELKETRESMLADLMAEMEERGIIKIDTPELLITYVPETQRESFDSKTFRADFPELYDDYVKMSPVKPSLRIKVRE